MTTLERLFQVFLFNRKATTTPVTTEILHLKINDDFHAKSESYRKLRDGTAHGGLIHQSYGLSLEDPTELLWILYLAQGFLPKDFTWPEEYGDFAKEISTISTAEPVSYFMSFDEVPSAITSAPVTEIAILSLHKSGDVEKYKQVQSVLVEAMKKAPGNHGAVFTVTETDRHRACVLAGWDTIEDQLRWMKQEAGLSHALQEHTAAMNVVHEKFTEHRAGASIV